MSFILTRVSVVYFFFFFQAEDGIRDYKVTGVQTCALPISPLIAAHPLAPGGGVHGVRGRAEGEDIKDHRLVVADPIGRDESALRVPAHEIGRASCRERV